VFVIDYYDPEGEDEREILNRIEFLRVPSHVRTLALSEFRAMYDSAGLKLLDPMTSASRTRFAEWILLPLTHIFPWPCDISTVACTINRGPEFLE